MNSEFERHTLSKLVHIDQKSLGKKTPEDFTFSYISLSDVSSGNISKTLEKHSFKSAPSRARRVLQNGDIIMATVRPNLQGFAKITEEFSHCVASTGFAVLSPKDNVSGEFIYQCLYSYQITKQIESLVVGSNYPAINSSDVAGLHIYTPPYPEQRKIAKILSTWDKAISTTERLIDNSKQQKKALMQQLLTGKKRLLDDSGTPFKGEWENAQLSNWLIEFKEKSLKQDQHRVYTSSRSGLVPQDEYFGNSRISDRKNIGFHVLPPEHITYRSRSDDGFFTFNLFKNNQKGIISHYYPVFTTKGSNSFFVALFEQYRSVFGKYSVGTSQKVLSFNALKEIRLKVPSKEEQLKIAAVLNNADKEIALLEQQLADLKQEKKALMQQLLTGKRRVKVDDKEVA